MTERERFVTKDLVETAEIIMADEMLKLFLQDIVRSLKEDVAHDDPTPFETIDFE